MTRFIPSYGEGYDENRIQEITARHGVPPLVARTLIRRGLLLDEDIHRFLHPEQGVLEPPEVFSQLDEAVKRIKKAVLLDEKICIYGDYDADGITATAILLDALSDLTEYVSYFIPSRHEEGYGLHRSAIDGLKAEGVSLIITVDNGIAAKDEALYCKELGIDLIVTDHHQPQDGHPDCIAVLSAAEECGDSPLCGAGVAMKLALALLPGARPERFLPLAAIATIADMVPLTGENRTIAALGLPIVANNLGIRALLASGDMLKRPVTETTVGFFIAPRLNAAGRMGSAGKAVELLRASTIEEALILADALEQDNAARRSQEGEIYAQATQQANGSFSVDDRAIVVREEGWNVGVVGIVASRLVEDYHVPALVFSQSGRELTGSGRSIPGVNLFEALYAVKEHFIRFGGHAMAAGVTLEEGEYAGFCRDLQDFLTENYDPSAFTPSYYFEEKAKLSEFTLSAAQALERLAPFGEGNREPVFLLEDLFLGGAKTMGKEKTHLSAEARAWDMALRLVGFSFGRYAQLIALGDRYDILSTVSVNTFQGVSKAELYLKQIRRHPDGNGKIMDAFWKKVLYNNQYGHNAEEFFLLAKPFVGPFLGIAPDKPRMKLLYRALSAALGTKEVLFHEFSAMLTPEQLAGALVFIELGFFRFDPKRGALSWDSKAPSRDLTESILYRWLHRINHKMEA